MKSSKGFTLIELIVVMAVFLFVVGAAIAIFISIIANQKKVLAEQELLNQVSYVEEYMSKALRMAKASSSLDSEVTCFQESNPDADKDGYVYLLTRPDTSADPSDKESGFYAGIKFLNQTGDSPTSSPICQEFYLGKCDPANPDKLVLCEIKNDSQPVPLTPANLQIISIKFGIDGKDGLIEPSGLPVAQAGDLEQPRVTIALKVKITGDNKEPERIIQTTISQRNLNVKYAQ